VWSLSRSGEPPERLEVEEPGARWVGADLGDAEQTRDALDRARPEVVVHLAAQSSVPASFKAPLATLENNFLGAANLLLAAADREPMPRVLAVGSSEEYGAAAPEELPVAEDRALAPLSPYGVSKAAQSLLALSLWRSRRLPAVVLRPFNHTGPGQPPRNALPAFARQVARIEAGLQEPVLKVGNLENRRDFTDVRDMARAYALAASQAEPGEVYNLGSGRSTPIRWLLDELLRLSPAQIRVEPDPERMVAAEITDMRADARKFRAATGWEPSIPLQQTVQNVLEYWRERTEAER
jgi:GDP-4-dehydro-6-deoxy-D-mannose reductase